MNILISGGTGFLGSHMVDLLVAEGHQVIILTRAGSSTSKISHNLDKVSLFDISDRSLSEAFSDSQIDQVIHLATYYGHDDNKYQVFASNLLFGNKLLELSIKYKVKRFLNTDSFSSQQDGLDYLPAYHLSKRHFKEWGELMTKDTGTRFFTLYLQHPYGTRDNDKKFTAFIIKKMFSGEPSVNLTAGKQRRDFIHSSDVARAYLAVMTATDPLANDYQVGTGKSLSIKGFVQLVKKLSGNEDIELKFGALPTRANEIMETKADISALAALGWEPQMDLSDGLTELVEYYRPT